MTRMARWSIAAAIVLAMFGCRARARFVTGQVQQGGEVVLYQPAPTTLLVRPAQDAASVEAAITTALAARRYVIESVEPGRVVARLDARRVTVRIALSYSADRIDVQYLDSTGLELQDTSRSRHYDNWVRQLSGSIESELGRPAREQAEAIARAEQARRDEEQRAYAQAERERQQQIEIQLEHERLALARAQADADAARAQQAAAEAQARVAAPRIEGSVQVVVPGFRFDARRARRDRRAMGFRRGSRIDQAVPGRAGGPMRAESLGLPPGCPGFFAQSPQHTIVLDADVPFLRIEAATNGDTTLAIVAPDGGVWCNDDFEGSLSPRIAGSFPAGVYQVYVGNYRGPEPVAYTLTLTDRPGSMASPIVVSPPVVVAVPDCRRTLIELGHSSTSLMFCDGAEPSCADALLRAGHAPTSLQFCGDVEPTCAVTMLQNGRSPTELMHCR